MMPKRPPQSQFGGNLPTYLQNKASSSQFTYFFGDSMEIRQKNWHSQKNTELSSNFDGFGGKLGKKTHKQKFKKSPPGKSGPESTYLPPGSCSSLFFSTPLACSHQLADGSIRAARPTSRPFRHFSADPHAHGIQALVTVWQFLQSFRQRF